MREEIEWTRELRTYHSLKLSILRNLTEIVQHLVTESDLKYLIKSEKELNSVDRALFDARINREKRIKPKEERKQEQPKPEAPLKFDTTDNKKQIEPLKQKTEKVEPKGISVFFKPREKAENSSLKSEIVIHNPLLKGHQTYQTEAKKLQQQIKLSWTTFEEFLSQMKQHKVSLPERSYRTINMSDYQNGQFTAFKFAPEFSLNPRAPLVRSDKIFTYDLNSDEERELLEAENEDDS